MGADWRRLGPFPHAVVRGNTVDFSLHGGRRQRVTIQEVEDGYLLQAIVAGRAVVSRLSDVPLRAWLRNREVQLVGFGLDAKGRLVAHAHVPTTGLGPEEFQLYLRAVASEADRFEYVLTGRDLR